MLRISSFTFLFYLFFYSGSHTKRKEHWSRIKRKELKEMYWAASWRSQPKGWTLASGYAQLKELILSQCGLALPSNESLNLSAVSRSTYCERTVNGGSGSIPAILWIHPPLCGLARRLFLCSYGLASGWILREWWKLPVFLSSSWSTINTKRQRDSGPWVRRKKVPPFSVHFLFLLAKDWITFTAKQPLCGSWPIAA